MDKISQKIANVAIVVDNYDKAIEFYTQKLNFDLVQDIKLSETKRWVLVSPPGDGNTNLLLAEATNDEQKSRIGNQTGGRVFLFLHTDDFERDFNQYTKNGVKFIEEPRYEEYGTVAVFSDLYGNLFDLIEPK